MAGIKYKYAINEQGHLVSIKHAYLEHKEGHIYHCISCGAKMIARLGEVRDWHFAHRGDEIHCSTETYLHAVAKRLIKQKFEKEEPFMVGYYREVKCSDRDNCPFKKEEVCNDYKLETFNLKDYYDTCQEEQQFGDYIADLLLSNFTKPDREPILIEIQVSHKSTPQKIASGLRIIEIRIKTEEDIVSLLSAPIVENPEAKIGRVRDVDTIGFAKFHGFKKQSSAPEPLAQRSIPRFYLFRSGKAYVTNMDDYNSCRNVWKKDNSKAIFEVSIDCSYLGGLSPYDYGYYVARQSGIEVKTCLFCKYHLNGYDVGFGVDPHFCCLYKKFGTPENPEPQYAKDCEYYREDRERLENIKETMPSFVVASH